eukprot:2631506-Amphidinium_carterae.1
MVLILTCYRFCYFCSWCSDLQGTAISPHDSQAFDWPTRSTTAALSLSYKRAHPSQSEAR